jgi:colanic acid/amylovoran biosynthesis glycosyltransferase
MTWLHSQVRFLPYHIDSHVFCDRTENLDQFAVPNIHSIAGDLPGLSRLSHVWWNGYLWLRRKHFLDQAERAQVRILHSHFGTRGWTDRRLASAAGLKHVVSFYGYDVNRLPTIEPLWRDRYGDLFDHVDLVLCEGPHLARCIEALGCHPDKVAVHHLGVRVNEIHFSPRSWTRGIPLRVLIAGTFTEKKGIPYAIEALGELNRSVPVEVTIIGDAGHQPRNRAEKEEIMRAIDTNGLRDNVSLLGYRPHKELFEEAYRHHIFISPSVTASDGDTEGGAPVTVIEMAATGMPVISTTHCDIPEVLEDGLSGLLAPERDASALLSRLVWLTEHPDRWQSMVHAARRRIIDQFNVKIQADRLAGFYKAVLGASPHGHGTV